MPNLQLLSIDVHVCAPTDRAFTTSINMTVQEAYNLLCMPSMAGLITSMVPVYGVPTVPESENKE